MRLSIAAIGVCACAAVSSAAVTGVTQTPSDVGVDSLDITDGSWDFYDGSMMDGIGDYGLWQGNIWMRELWSGAANTAVGFDTSVTTSGRLSTVPIVLNKNVTNTSTFDFTGYDIRVIAQGGTSIGNVLAASNSEYSSVTVTEVVAGLEFLISFDAVSGDAGTVIGDDTTFSFSFDIDGGVDFEIIQVAIPTPGSAALVVVGSAFAVRRRR